MIARTHKLLFSITKTASRSFCAKFDHIRLDEPLVSSKLIPEGVRDSFWSHMADSWKKTSASLYIPEYHTEFNLWRTNYKMQHVVECISSFMKSLNEYNYNICTCNKHCACNSHGGSRCPWHDAIGREVDKKLHRIINNETLNFINNKALVVINDKAFAGEGFWNGIHILSQRAKNSNDFTHSYVNYLYKTDEFRSDIVNLFYENLQKNLDRIIALDNKLGTNPKITLVSMNARQIEGFNDGGTIQIHSRDNADCVMSFSLAKKNFTEKNIFPIVYRVEH